jgi:hypothetical protein
MVSGAAALPTARLVCGASGAGAGGVPLPTSEVCDTIVKLTLAVCVTVMGTVVMSVAVKPSVPT